MKAQSILPYWNQENASSSQRWKTLAGLFNDYSSLSLSENPSWNLWDLKPENRGGILFPFDASIDGRVEPSIFAFSHNFIWILQERVALLFFVGFIVVFEEIYTSMACDLAISERTVFAFFSLPTVVFFALWFVKFFLTYFKASTSCGLFSLCYLWYFRTLV